MSNCNRYCYDCFNHPRFEDRKQGKMQIKTYHRVIRGLELMNFKGRLGLYMCNEPLLDRRMFKLVQYAKEKLPECNILIATNGDFLNKKKYLSLMKAGVDRILVTDYGPPWTLNKMDHPKIDYRKHTEITKANRAGKLYSHNGPIDRPCSRVENQLAINWKGEVVLCCCDYYGEYVFGNVRNLLLEKIWNDPKFMLVRQILADNRTNLDFCKYCDL